MTGQYESLHQQAGELGAAINNATDVVGVLHGIDSVPDISGGRKEELVEFLIHLLACAKARRDKRIMIDVREAEYGPVR